LNIFISFETHLHKDVGRVLTGIQVPSDMSDDFDKFLKELGYAYVEESDNPIFDLFLR
jgi:threonine dehydratase